MLEVFWILLIAASSCGLLGSILVVRNQGMLADALSHSVLLGIVLGFFISQSLESPLLVIGATVFGVLSVFVIRNLHRPKLAEDAATGLVFTFFFAVAVLLISLFARNVHLDMDMVLMGEVIFTPLNRVVFGNISLPLALVKEVALFLLNVLFFLLTYQPLKSYLFDANQARLTGVRTGLLDTGILLLVSLTTVVSFESVGSMTVIVFLLAPAMTALPWSRSWRYLLGLGQLVVFVSTLVAYTIAVSYDLTMSGMCAVVSLVLVCISIFLKKTLKV